MSDEETYVVFTEESIENLSELDGNKQQQILSRLIDIADSESLPSQFVHESIGRTDIITAGDTCRLYAKIVENIPEGNSTYHFIYVMYIDHTHEYAQKDLVTYDQVAASFVSVATSFDDVDSVEDYISENPAFNADDLRQRLQ